MQFVPAQGFAQRCAVITLVTLGHVCYRASIHHAKTAPRGALPHLRTLARRKCDLNIQTEPARAKLWLTFPHISQYENGEPCNICGHTLARAQPAPAVNSAFPSEILPGFLYLGSYDNASRSELLKAQAITHILNVRMHDALLHVCCLLSKLLLFYADSVYLSTSVQELI